MNMRTTLFCAVMAAFLAAGSAAAQAPPAGDAVAPAEASGAEGGSALEPAAAAAATAETGAPVAPTLSSRIDSHFGTVVSKMAGVLFLGIPLGGGREAPFIVAWLFVGAVFLTFRLKFVNFTGFRHALDVVRGQYDDPSHAGEVTHFQALASALSATVGLGNIAGVALAVKMGGPGAVFWMLVAAFFGMTAKFAECTMGLKYRTFDAHGHVLGGPMRYLKEGLTRRGLGPLGGVLALMFAVFCIGGSFGGGNMFQANQSYSAVNEACAAYLGVAIPREVFGLVMVAAVGVVIIGGFKRIAQTAEKIVPLMCGLYVLTSAFIVLTNLDHLPIAIGEILSDAFSGEAAGGGLVGAMVMGIRRASFSNEAGIGSAAIAHAAARTDEPVSEGYVALLEPFIDTIIVCFATGIVIVNSGVAADPANAALDGAVLTMRAFEQSITWFPLVLTVSIVLFAYSTMISWSYYGERCWTLFFGPKSSTAYRVVFLVFVYVGSVATLSNVLDFSDLMILSMAFPNILGLYILSNELVADVRSYQTRLARGEITKRA